jgi:hypothetical protein
MILLVLVLWRLTRGKLLCIVLFLSIFQAASVLNLGDMGVAPWILTVAIGLSIQFLKRPLSAPALIDTNPTPVRLLMVFVGYAIFSGLLYPILFRGVLVQGSHDLYPAPLVLGIANIAQICYLLAAVAVFGLALFSTRKEIDRGLDWYVHGCVVASVFAMYQLANALTGLPYPAAVFYSNPRYVIYPAYMINGMWRLNSTFTEASSLASHLSVGIALLGWNVTTRPFHWRSAVSLALMVLTLLLTLSSTGYLSMIVLLLATVALTLRALLRTRSLSRIKTIFILLIVLVVTSVLLTTGAGATIDKALHSVLLDKENTSSYRERTASNDSAIETARQTYYMGAGWGSVRCSSLGAGLLATVGLIGVLVFCAFLISLMLPLFKRNYDSRFGDVYEKSLLATLVILAAMMVAGNEPDQPILWVLFAACAAGPNTYRSWRKSLAVYRTEPVFFHTARSL